MRKRQTVYIIIGVVTLALILFLQYNKKKELNWYPSYVSHHKIPYGTIVLHDLVKKKFKNIHDVSDPPFTFLKSNNDNASTYVFINNTVSFAESELDKLLEWTAKREYLIYCFDKF